GLAMQVQLQRSHWRLLVVLTTQQVTPPSRILWVRDPIRSVGPSSFELPNGWSNTTEYLSYTTTKINFNIKINYNSACCSSVFHRALNTHDSFSFPYSPAQRASWEEPIKVIRRLEFFPESTLLLLRPQCPHSRAGLDSVCC